MGNARKVTPVERRYDKGERRFKHVGSGEKPEFEKGPRGVVGKCPATIPAEERDRLLNMAVPLSNGDRDLTSPKKIYAVYQGAVYEAQTSDYGRTYHAYPFRGKLSSAIIALLAKMADDEGCRPEFNTWVDNFITRHGQ
jgi:hypothetical protein